MLTLALSMILFGLLVKSTGLGGTDGFNIKAVSLLGIPLSGAHRMNGLILLLVLAVLAALTLFFFNRTAFGRLLPGIKDNEIRVEYLGASATLSIHIAYVLAAAVAALGGAMSGIVVGHVDPELAFWSTSGEFVVIAVLAGTGNMLTPFIAALVLEIIRSYAYQHAPNLWQMVLGAIILALILFMPDGLGGIKLGSRKAEAPR
jgi:branched-chain amino acid transport system permease protein